MRILIAEDEWIESQALKEMLIRYYPEQAGEVMCCGDGRAAVKTAEEMKPDIIIMDIEMPFMNGIEASRRIREFDQKVIIIMLTAYGTFDYARESIRNGVLDYLMKPYGPKTICQVMDKAIAAVQRTVIADRTAGRLNEILGREFLLRLIMNQRFSKEEQDTYGQILDLEGASYVLLALAKEEWADHREALLGMAEKKGLRKIWGEYGGVCFLVCYGRDRGSLETMRAWAVREGRGELGEQETDWGKLGLLLARRARPESELQKELYQAVLDRDLEKAKAAGTRLAVSMGVQSGELDNRLTQIFHELVCEIAGEDWDRAGRLEYLLDIGFSTPYLGDKDRAVSDFCGNLEKFVRYMTHDMEQKNHRMIEQAKAYMREHYARDISLEDVAAYVSVSKYYLSRMFKSVTGENLKDFLLEHRIQEAKKLLLAGSTVAEAAYSCGFRDPAYFSKCFKRVENCSPGSYR